MSADPFSSHHRKHHRQPSHHHHHVSRIVERFRSIKLNAVMDKWKHSVFTPQELNDKATFQRTTLHIEHLLHTSPPGHRSSDQINVLVAWLPRAFPQLFVPLTSQEMKEGSERTLNKLNSMTLANRLMPSQRMSNLTKSRGAHMSAADLRLLANRIKAVTFPTHSVLFQQGDAAKSMFGILRGEAEVFVQDFNIKRKSLAHAHDSIIAQHKKGYGNLVARLSCGDILGELGLSK